MDHDVIKPYDKSGDKKQQVQSMFDKVAPYYDFLNRFLTLRIDVLWRRNAINAVKSDQIRDICDIATGTADLAIEMAKAMPSANVIGIDIAPKMLEIGSKKIIAANFQKRITLETGDSEALRFESQTFDLVTSSFGVRNFQDLNLGLSEMHRILRPGGKIMVLEFSRPRIFPIKQLFNIYFRYALPFIGKITSKDPRAYKYLYESVQQFPDYERFTSVLQEVGFINTSFKPLTFGICTVYLASKL